jgi:hypothetical protein
VLHRKNKSKDLIYKENNNISLGTDILFKEQVLVALTTLTTPTKVIILQD